MPAPDPPQHDWIEPLVKLAGALGFNQVQLRWKLIRLGQRLQRSKRHVEVEAERIRYAHKVCRSCGGVIDRAERVCPACGARVSSRAVQLLGRIGLAVPHALSVSSLLGLAMAVIYARMILASGGGGLLSFPTDLLFRFGAHWPPAVWGGEPWRLGTSVFLHIGLWHLGFNLIALSQIGPVIEDLYGRARMLCWFMVTGVLANLGSEALGLAGVAAGASGAIMGLCGVAAGWGQRQGTTIGRDVRNRMLKWALYTLVFGWFIHADNGAHAAGFVAGAVLGYLLRPDSLRRPSLRPLGLALDLLGVAAAVLAVALTLLGPAGPPRG
jgi:membrane associated rhomboid family serine protease